MRVTGDQLSSALFAGLAVLVAPPAKAKPVEQAGYQPYLAACHANRACNGTYIVARHGKPIFAAAFGDAGDQARTPLTMASSFDIGSISKQFTAMAVLRLVAAGTIDLDGKIASELPGFPYPDITVRQLLSHTSGIANAMPYYNTLLRSGKATAPVTGSDIVSVLVDQRMPAVAEPGARFAYSNAGYMVLAALVARKSGRPFDAYLEQTFFKPLGMRDTRLRTPANEPAIRNRAFGFADSPIAPRRTIDQLPSFFIFGAGGIYSTAPDLLRWQNALNAGRVVPKRLLALATTPARLPDGSTAPYCFGLSLQPDANGAKRISHSGHWRAFKADLSYYPGTDVTVIQLTNNSQDDSVDANSAALASIAGGGAPSDLPGPIGWALVDRLGSDEESRSWFAAELSRQPRRYDIQETELDTLGYTYLRKQDAVRAVRTFKLATLAFPRSANAFASLADAQEAAGDSPAAHASMRSAVALDPASRTYAMRAEELKARLR